MNNTPKLFISIGDLEISLITGHDDQNSFELLEKLILPIDGIYKNKILDIDKISDLIRTNILIIEQKVNFTFKDIIVILDNLEISFLNLCGFKKLNGTQIYKENITYIINSLKSCVDEFEENKKIIHIFNSEYSLDKKKLDNLPIGLFGDFYSHELSFNLINKNDYKNLEQIFRLCNLKIKKILLESFVKGSLISDLYPKIETFYYLNLREKNSKFFFVNNNATVFEQKFNFGTEIISKDISKITSLNINIIEQIINNNEKIHEISETELIEERFFEERKFRKIKKKLIRDIASARIKELSELIYSKNINFKYFNQKNKKIFIEVNNNLHLKCFQKIYKDFFNFDNKFEVIFLENLNLKDELYATNRIVQFGWKKEAIPISKSKKSIIARFFNFLFND